MHVDPRDFNRAFEGIDYPTSKDAVLRSAADKGGLDGGVQIVLEAIPDRTYESEDDLMLAVDAACLDGERITGGLAEPTPAAPAEPALKEAASAGAETENHSAA